MNGPLAPWFALLFTTLGGGALLVGLAWLFACRARPAVALVIWRTALIGLALLPLLEVVGLTTWLAGLIPTSAATDAIEVATPPPSAPPPTLHPPARWPGWLWAAGTILLAGRWLLSKLLLRRLRRRMQPLTSPELQVRIEHVARQLGCAVPVAAQSPALSGPMVFAVWGPVLALPADFAASYTAGQQDAILAHELGHLANRDPHWHDLAEALTALVWWNPLHWWARSLLVQASEAAADEATLALEDGPVLLAESLLCLAQRLTARQAAGTLGVTGGLRSRLAVRVRRLLNLRPAHVPQRAGQRGRFVAAVFLLASIGAVVVVSSWLRPAGTQASFWPTMRAEATSQRTSVPRQRTDEEAIAKLGLSAEQQRRFRALRAELDADNAALYRLKSGHIERGIAINQKWRAGLQTIFTPQQYADYRAYWESPGVRLAAPVRRPE